MRRTLFVAVAALSLLASPAVLPAQPPTQTGSEPQFAARLSPAELKVETALARPVKLSYREQALQDVIADLAKQADLAIELSPEGLEDADVTPDELVTLELGTLKLRQGLEVLLGPLHLSVTPGKTGLLVTSAEVDHHRTLTRIYPVADLVPVTRQPDSEAALDLDFLIDTLTSHLSPDSWTDSGGLGSAQVGPGSCLIVTQTYPSHLEIDQFLGMLRRLKSDHASLQPDDVGPIVRDRAIQALHAALEARDSQRLDVELKSYLQEVAKVIKHPVVMDPEGLEEANVSADQIVQVAYRDLPIGEGLRKTLSKLHLRYMASDGYLVVTSFEKHGEGYSTRLYPVSDLAPLRAIQEPPVRDFDSLVDFITSSSDHAGTWVDNGGSSQISSWPEPAALVITTTDKVHDDIEELLARLRQTDLAAFNAEQARADQRIVERIYPLYTTRREKQAKAAKGGEPADQLPTADDVAKLIAELLPEVSFKEEGTLLRPFHDRLIVRHRPAMLHKIEKLLEKIEAWPPQPRTGNLGGGGFFDISSQFQPRTSVEANRRSLVAPGMD